MVPRCLHRKIVFSYCSLLEGFLFLTFPPHGPLRSPPQCFCHISGSTALVYRCYVRLCLRSHPTDLFLFLTPSQPTHTKPPQTPPPLLRRILSSQARAPLPAGTGLNWRLWNFPALFVGPLFPNGRLLAHFSPFRMADLVITPGKLFFFPPQ